MYLVSSHPWCTAWSCFGAALIRSIHKRRRFYVKFFKVKFLTDDTMFYIGDRDFNVVVQTNLDLNG